MGLRRWRDGFLALAKLIVWTSNQESDVAASPTITSGSAAPTASEPKGSLYLRTGGSGASSILYVATDSSGTWSALGVVATAVQVQTAGGETYVIDVSASATGEALVKLKDNLASAFEIKEGANSYLKFTTTDSGELLTFGKPIAFASTAQLIADPGDAGAIPVTRNGVCSLTSAGAETRTIANPTFSGQRISLVLDVDGGSCVVTAAGAINQAGNTIMTINDVNDYIALEGVKCAGGNLRWRVMANDGVALS